MKKLIIGVLMTVFMLVLCTGCKTHTVETITIKGEGSNEKTVLEYVDGELTQKYTVTCYERSTETEAD